MEISVPEVEKNFGNLFRIKVAYKEKNREKL